MSNLVVKNTNESADPTRPFIFPDAMTDEGTLFNIDFSNAGALIQYDLAKGITDLAYPVQLRHDNSINTDRDIAASSTGTIPQLTDRRGMPMTFLGTIDQNQYTTGIRIRGVNQYLYENQPRALLIAWISLDSTIENTNGGPFIRSNVVENDGGNHPANIRFHIPGNGQTTNVSIIFATKSSFTNQTLQNDVPTQLAVEFVGANEPNRLFVNGIFVGLGTQTEGSFGSPVGEDIIALGGVAINNNYRQVADVYHFDMRDLSVTGKTADDVVAQNYEYANGIGRYAGRPTRRAYANRIVE